MQFFRNKKLLSALILGSATLIAGVLYAINSAPTPLTKEEREKQIYERAQKYVDAFGSVEPMGIF